ncbi:hypothetical protein BKG95_10325 [Rodentibacter pneumotropicus]|uniref:Uncharacterized protein n=2 Tax=Rodentibacter TaxID=1960084 RepID=A0AAW5LD32_9PAST|nr:hypothetical protein [Rodentibacter pneumotropicus]MCQ9121286.1 hypothetical protein [Rodentibacter pneumotropicus]OOF46914.1 hypothetical protein BKK52_10410 [Rodentibacter trehalosifermentans]OOF66595.1 hypothetical protein BKG95_10325 [Rodentibacter pneumotropicus]
MARRQIYAVYRGEENLGDGTAEELAKKLGVRPKTVQSMSAQKGAWRKQSNKRLIVIKLDKEEV